MKAIKIDTETQTIAMIDIDDGLKALQEQVKGNIEIALRTDEDIVWCNEEGLYLFHQYTWWPNQKRIFTGPLIVLGYTEDGGNKDVSMTIEEAEQVEFINRLQAHELALEYGL